MILSESKRDDLLLPYVEMLKAKGINCSLGQLKSYMLKKLTNEARMRNLSLGSNFYLAGAIRYYFNGDLTLNKDLDVYNDGQTTNDVWNEDACQKLNALINILRNAYIDTIGETFEQPEDFGTLTLPKLLRKYGKKIQKEIDANGGLEIDGNDENDGLDRNDRVGQNYSYEIIYSYKQATKYNQYTDPGAWCITYGKQHYNSYIKMLNIHYVIFKQDGFENVKREFGPEWTSQKPQDEYGCSLIAVLQSNKNGEPIYITSRWNHGYERHCEADHAFTKEEFCKKTGVTDADLQRIFAIWKNDYPKYSEDDYHTGGSVSKEEKLDVLRKLKYAQMRINGGDMNISDTIKILTNLNGSQDGIDEGKVKITKGVYWCRTAFQGTCFFYFLMDKGKIVFETLLPDSMGHECYSSNVIDGGGYRSRTLRGYTNLVVIVANRFIMLYDLRRHCIINIDGETKFKCIPRGDSSYTVNNKSFYEVRYGKEQFALLNAATNTPLKLPNGSCWINYLRSNCGGGYGGSILGNSNLHARRHYGDGEGGEIFEIIYDASSRERYFYDVDKKTFLGGDNIPQPEDPRKMYKLCTEFRMPGAVAFKVDDKFSNINGVSYYSPIKLMINGEFVTIDGCSEFRDISYYGDSFLIYAPYSNSTSWDYPRMMYDLQSKSNILNPDTGGVFKFKNHPNINGYDAEYSRFLFFTNTHLLYTTEGYRRYGEFIFDKETRSFLKNPCGFPGAYTFAIATRGKKDGSGIVIACNENAPGTWDLKKQVDAGDIDAASRSYRILSIPGIDNSNPYPQGDYYDMFNNVPRVEVGEQSQEYSVDDVQQMVREAINKILKK